MRSTLFNHVVASHALIVHPQKSAFARAMQPLTLERWPKTLLKNTPVRASSPQLEMPAPMVRAQPLELLDLPDELILKILGYADDHTLAHVDLSCKTLSGLARDSTLELAPHIIWHSFSSAYPSEVRHFFGSREARRFAAAANTMMLSYLGPQKGAACLQRAYLLADAAMQSDWRALQKAPQALHCWPYAKGHFFVFNFLRPFLAERFPEIFLPLLQFYGALQTAREMTADDGRWDAYKVLNGYVRIVRQYAHNGATPVLRALHHISLTGAQALPEAGAPLCAGWDAEIAIGALTRLFETALSDDDFVYEAADAPADEEALELRAANVEIVLNTFIPAFFDGEPTSSEELVSLSAELAEEGFFSCAQAQLLANLARSGFGAAVLAAHAEFSKSPLSNEWLCDRAAFFVP